MTDPKKSVKLGGKNFYYVAIDGTDAVDSAEFGVEIEKFGFRNLLGEMLKSNKSPDDAARIPDPNHAFLPIWRVVPDIHMASETRNGKKNTYVDENKTHGVADAAKGVAVVCPLGLNSWATDDFWAAYPGGAKQAIADTGAIMEQLILKPCAVWDGKQMGVATGKETAKDTVFPPQILTISSHGWLGGFMNGNAPVVGSERVGTPNWFIIGGVADKGKKFEGPVWLILAQCSTVCTATWTSWVKVMGRSVPPVRGVIAYEEVAPAAGSASLLAQHFFQRMQQTYPAGTKDRLGNPIGGKPISFIDAWGYVNKNAGRRWAAVVHKEAEGDSLSTFDQQAPLKDLDVDKGCYLGWSHTEDENLDGQPITKKDPPFTLGLALVADADPARRRVVTEANLDGAFLVSKINPASGKKVEIHYEVSLEPPAGASGAIVEATIEWVHIRKSKPKFDMRRIFHMPPPVDAGLTAKYVYKGNGRSVMPGEMNLLTVTVPKAQGLKKLVVRFDAVDSFASVATEDDHYQYDDKIIAHHSYLWLRASLKLDGGTEYKPFDFTTRGLLYFG